MQRVIEADAGWRAGLAADPIEPLLDCGDPAVILAAERDLLGKRRSTQTLWELPEVLRILRRQQPDGSWLYAGNQPGLAFGEDYAQLETYRRFAQLLKIYGLDRRHPAIESAAEYFFTRQTSEGDFRGIYGRQYSPNYSAAIAELLIAAGYAKDERLEPCFRWLLFVRQDDGGWAIPWRTQGRNIQTALDCSWPLEPVRSRPSSHMVTGVVLRAFAAHRSHRSSEAARRAGALLVSRFFERDAYPDRGSADFWQKITFPFWFTDFVSALDALGRIEPARPPAKVTQALDWLRGRQGKDGVFRVYILKNRSVPNLEYWISLAICRVLRLWCPRPAAAGDARGKASKSRPTPSL
jgi:hypothetical protein